MFNTATVLIKDSKEERRPMIRFLWSKMRKFTTLTEE